MIGYLKGWEAVTDQELEDMSIEERNRIIDAYRAEVDEDLRDQDYAEIARDYKVLVLA